MVRSTRKLAAGVAQALTRTGRRAPSGTPARPADAEPVAPATRAPATKAPATKAPAKKAPAKKAPAKKAPAKKAPATKAAATKAAAKKTPAKRTSAAKASAKKASATKAPATKAPAKKAPAKKAPATKAPAKKRPARKTSAAKAPAKKAPVSALVVQEGEAAWSDAELAELLSELHEQRDHSSRLIADKDAELADLLRDSGDGAGLDQADVGASQFERDHELSVLGSERDKLAQVERALARIDDGSYGVCESCGQAVGKNRLMAFPRATLCMTCKQREERR